MKFRTKMFTEERVYRRVNGAAPNEWEPVKLSKPIDAQINEWVEAERARLVFASAPSVTPSWLDKEMTTRSMLIAVIIAYESEEARKPDEQPYQWPEYVPGPDGGAAPPPGPDAPFGGH